MEPAFLVPETTIHANGESPAIELPTPPPDSLLVTLGLTKVVEQEALLVSIQGSSDGLTWGAAPLAFFPQKFYTGVSAVLLDLRRHPDIRFIRAQWKASRWGRGDKTPSFTFYVFIEPTAAVTAG
jgi:hypothetical protein